MNEINDKSKKLNFVLVLLLLIVIVYKLLFFPVKISGHSMYPTYKNGEKYKSSIFIDRESIEKDTVITFLNKENYSLYVKRVVATEGDVVLIKDGDLYVNGIKEDSDFEKMAYAGIAEKEIVVGKNEYFVLGDNRNNSYDSREMGLIKSKQIISIIKDKEDK